MATTRRTSQRVTLLMLVLASVTVLTLDYHGEANRGITHVRTGFRDAISPVQRAIAAVLHPIGDFFAGGARYGAVQAQNQQLQNEIGRLRQKSAEYAFEQQQLRQIQALDHLSFASGLHGIDAVVLSAPTSNFRDTLEIDHGTAEGVAAGEPVVGSKGLIGTVISAGSSTATVQLITDSRSTVGVVFGTSGAGYGIVAGQGRGARLVLQAVSGSPFRHEVLYTAGTVASGVSAYPAGLPVGTVSDVRNSTGGFSKSVSVAPLANLSSLQYVAVLAWQPPA